ncbi:uncharacterized protein CEXT_188381 [Caerostris extrusa]|uniref:Uncharacterized protein n=1 Tax=Caerostris extrusa TaxID=172846 RepID=A0AAV4TEN6_CAEEX|nr:uncharacterized protein CEXT_188381 [Caerostris extrusa]
MFCEVRTSAEECTLHQLQSCLESLTVRHKRKRSGPRHHPPGASTRLQNSEGERFCAQIIAFAAYLKHSPCYQNVSLSEDRCAPYYRRLVLVSEKVDERKDVDHRLRESCCAFNEFVLCKYVHVNQDCGEEAAVFLQRHLDHISSPLLQEHCAHYTYPADSCLPSSATPTCSPLLQHLLRNAISALITKCHQWMSILKWRKYFIEGIIEKTYALGSLL